MELYFAVPLVLVALLVAASGIAAIASGWVLPMRWNRHQIRRVRLHGYGQLTVAFALCWQVVVSSTALSDSGWADDVSLASVLTGIILMAVS
ncbi:hypothetical protein AB0L59_30075 [Streptomyces sp. NPDC052109]|uniref:hypothetical protein n=1 Tax=Streptomyces sp. NPDC052109 TaxID=3155527 RepID=UPI003421673C